MALRAFFLSLRLLHLFGAAVPALLGRIGICSLVARLNDSVFLLLLLALRRRAVRRGGLRLVLAFLGGRTISGRHQISGHRRAHLGPGRVMLAQDARDLAAFGQSLRAL